MTQNAAIVDRGEMPGGERLTLLPWTRDIRPWHVRSFSRARDYLREFLKRHGGGSPAGDPEQDISSLARKRRAFFRKITPPLYSLTGSLFPRFFHPDKGDAVPFDPPRSAAIRIARALHGTTRKPDLIIHLYLDMYDMTEDAWARYESVCPTPWVGVRFDPPADPCRDGFCRIGSCRGAFFLDEGAAQRYAAYFGDKHISFLSDVTDTRLPTSPTVFETEVRRKSAGRKIVFMGGTIGGQKDLATWYELIRTASKGRFYFLQVGEVIEGTLSIEDRAAYDAVIKDPPENFFCLSGFLPDEAEFNALIRASDIIYAVYRDFRLSSNMLAKAACFEKPILVSGRYVMGERVRRYSLGLTVAEGDVDGIAEALDVLATRPGTSYGFAKYRSDFSEERFADALDSCVKHCLDRG